MNSLKNMQTKKVIKIINLNLNWPILFKEY